MDTAAFFPGSIHFPKAKILRPGMHTIEIYFPQFYFTQGWYGGHHGPWWTEDDRDVVVDIGGHPGVLSFPENSWDLWMFIHLNML